MFDHVKFGVSDYAAAKAFFLAALAPLGVTAGTEGSPSSGIELIGPGEPSLILFQTDEKPAHLHLAFEATTRAQVDAFYRAALAAGGHDNGPPGIRPQYNVNYYAAFVIGPDGHNVEAVCHLPPGIVLPTDDEDAAITAAAESDPDALPLTPEQLQAMVPLRDRQ